MFLVIFEVYQWAMGKGLQVSKTLLFELYSWVLRALVCNVDLGHGDILISKKKSVALVLNPL